ncbi:MAG: sterol desaturase family protein [Alphaproteobacteria bacterium]|nr:sterol desaturase family protein [Alphaproteobacteria bacterium]HRW28786.1 sterol desaturase family protein [Emcibacteraceae bacterium]
MDFLVEHEQVIRVGVFLAILVLLSGLEFLIPLAKRRLSRPTQWFTNLVIVLLDNLTLKIVFPLLAAGVAKYANDNGYGLFNIISAPYWVSFVLSLILLDLLIYTQHVMMHRIPILWRFHRMHHTELGLDATSALRFHPIEIIISMLIKMGFVLIMGIPVAAVIIFEVLLNGLALFNHSNIKLPEIIEKPLRRIIITPEIHWIHHSELPFETNSNYGFNLSLWDRLFSTYIDKPKQSYKELRQGLHEFGFKEPLNVLELLVSPFKEYPAKGDKKIK